jgi:hypothetical protein
MTSIIKVDEIQNSAGTTTLAKVDNGVLTGALSPATGFRNRIINGDMRIDQRNAGASVNATSTPSYCIDRYSIFGTGGTSRFSVQQNAGSVTPPVGFTNYLGATSLTAYSVGATDNYIITQFIEGNNISDLAWGTANAVAVTLSFWVRSSLTGTFGGAIQNGDLNRSYPFTYTINSINTWEYKTITVPGDTTGTWLTNNGRGITVRFPLGVGTTLSGTSGSWAASDFRSATGAVSVVATSGATFYITGVQLEKGTVATPFEFRSIGQELALCQRYYENNYPTGTAVGSIVGDAISFGLAYRSGLAAPHFGMVMQQRKRATPTFTVWNGVTGGSGTWRGSGFSNESTTISGNQVSFTAVTTVSDSLIRSAFFEASAEL